MSTAPPGFLGAYRADFATRAAYSEGAGPYRIVPHAVAIPRDLDDLLALVGFAQDIGQPLVPRGAGSGMPGNNVGPGIVVDLREFRGPVAVSGDGVANVGAAVTWGALDRAAQPLGLRLRSNPSSGAVCTLGGMVSTNAAGPRVGTGNVRPAVRGVELVTVDGDVGWLGRRGMRRRPRSRRPGEPLVHDPVIQALRRFEQQVRPAITAAATQVTASFPRTTKNSSGYALDHYLATGDVLDLVIGSEGTLGFITRVELALEPRPAGAAALLLTLDELGALPGVVTDLLPFDPSAVELLDRTFLALAAPRLPFPTMDLELVLLVEFERAEQAAAETVAHAASARVASRCPRRETAFTAAARQRLWDVRHAASPALAALPASRRSLQIIEDGCVPVPVLDRYLAGVRAAAARHGVEVVAFGHAGDGHLHVNALADTGQAGFEGRLAALLEDVTALVTDLGGTPSGEHGDGRMRAALLERVFGPRTTALFREVKRAFDPRGILNPGVIVPADGPAGVSDLKVGPGAQPIPPEIEERLRQIERSAGWDRAKSDLVEDHRASA